jgi:hypothetical protein
MSILNSPKLSKMQRAFMKENYEATIAEAEVNSNTEGLTWFLRVTFTLVWVGLLAQFYLSEVPLVIERMNAFGVWWVIVVETISAGLATVGLVLVFLVQTASERNNEYESVHDLMSGLLSLEKRLSFGSFVSWCNNFLVVVLMAISGWTAAAVFLAFLTFSVVCYIFIMKSMVLNYYSELTPSRIDFLRGLQMGEEKCEN